MWKPYAAVAGDIARQTARRLVQTKWSSFAIVSALAVALALSAGSLVLWLAASRASLPYPEAGRLAWGDEALTNLCFSRPSWTPRRRLEPLFSSLAAYTIVHETLGPPHPTERLAIADVTADFFRVVGVGPQLGTIPGAHDGPSVLLSDAFWRSGFGADPSIVGHVIALDGRSVRVAGVASSALQLPQGVAAWRLIGRSVLPVAQSSEQSPAMFRLVGRLHAGMSFLAANSYLRHLAEIRHSDGRHAALIPLREHLFGQGQRLAWYWLISCLLVLVAAICSAGAACALRGVAAARQEWIRSAMGAGKRRLAAERICEGLLLALLSLAGAGAILALARKWLTPAGGAATVAPLLMCWAVVAGALLLLAGVRKSSRARQGVLCGCMIASTGLSVLLLVFAHELLLVSQQDVGLDGQNALIVAVAAPPVATAAPGPMRGLVWELDRRREEEAEYYRESVIRIRQLPGVVAVGVISDPPYSGMRPVAMDTPFLDPPLGGEPSAYSAVSGAVLRSMDTGAVAALGMKVVYGRSFLPSDAPASVAVVNAALASRIGPGRAALGHTIGYIGEPARRIVGILANLSEGGPQSPVAPTVYFQAASEPTPVMSIAIRMRSRVSPAGVYPAIARAIAPAGSGAAISWHSEEAALVRRARAEMTGTVVRLLAIAAAALSLVGFGVVQIALIELNERRREFAIRLALGSDARGLAVLIAWKYGGLGLFSAAAGCLTGWALSRGLAALLPGNPGTPFLAYALGAFGPATLALLCLVTPVVAGAHARHAKWMHRALTQA